jgi:hypothetical protein
VVVVSYDKNTLQILKFYENGLPRPHTIKWNILERKNILFHITAFSNHKTVTAVETEGAETVNVCNTINCQQ